MTNERKSSILFVKYRTGVRKPKICLSLPEDRIECFSTNNIQELFDLGQVPGIPYGSYHLYCSSHVPLTSRHRTLEHPNKHDESATRFALRRCGKCQLVGKASCRATIPDRRGPIPFPRTMHRQSRLPSRSAHLGRRLRMGLRGVCLPHICSLLGNCKCWFP